ncbi:protein Star [Eurytemora carolleeae]|uniref:protein Star n=1 Tax=Eurytemora carolleeae TaxID=1294199 RepID=UPI000C7891EC|nr:protein Star [Eurytemora carolleeae]|eukprot:XP_023327396.1 protein Star-like [Eurytemora affinis]
MKMRFELLNMMLLILNVSGSEELSEEHIFEIDFDTFKFEQDDPKLVEYVKSRLLIKTGTSSGQNLNLSRRSSNMRGQFDQAVEVDQIYNSSLRDGFFIEAGAWDGEHISNTLLLEVKRDWSGLLIEPNPETFKSLKGKNRNAWISPACLSTTTRPIIIDFKLDGLLGGIVGNQDKKTDSEYSTVKVSCVPLYTMLLALNNPTVHYFSLDIEGAELKVLKTVPWNLVDIWLLGIESNHVGELDSMESRSDIIEFMVAQGYRHIGTVGIDDFFVKPDKVYVTDELFLYLQQLRQKQYYALKDQ